MTPQDVKKISIRLLPDGFSYLNQFHSVLPGADYNRRLQEAILEVLETAADGDADECACSIENTRFCLTPLEVEPSLAQLMYTTSLPTAENEETTIEMRDEERGVRFTFGVDAELYHFILRNWPYTTFTHPLFELYGQWAGREEVKSDCMVADASERHLNVVVFRNGGLHLANRFEVTGEDNILYHLMNCWTQCELDVLTDTLYLQTEVKELGQNIGQYIKHCEIQSCES